MSTEHNKGARSQAEIYGDVAIMIGATTGGVIAGVMASYQLKKALTKEADKDKPAMLAKLSPLLISSAATFGAMKAEDKYTRAFFVGVAAGSAAVSTFNLIGNETTSSLLGVTLSGAPLPQRKTEYEHFEEDAPDEEEGAYALNLPRELQTREEDEPTMQGFAALPQGETEYAIAL